MIELSEALEAYELLRSYCREHNDCKGCLLEASEDVRETFGYKCVMELEAEPRYWDILKIGNQTNIRR